MNKKILYILCLSLFSTHAFGQYTDEGSNLKQLRTYRDSLTSLGNKFINDPDEMVRKQANYGFIKTLVSALKINNSFNFSFDQVKAVSVLNSPDNRFRIFSWHVVNEDGSYRFYGTVQMNTGGQLMMHPLEDHTPLIKNPEDSVSDNHHWYGAQYYKIIPVTSAKNPYYVLLGWKGNTVRSTKKIIEVISFKNNKAIFGADVFNGNKKTRKRVVFEYARQASMLLRYIPEEHLIVFDHLSPPDKQSADKPESFGPDLSYDGYRLKNGVWQYAENLDMRNIPTENDNQYIDPKKEAEQARDQVPKRRN